MSRFLGGLLRGAGWALALTAALGGGPNSDARAADGAVRILAFGDSLTHGYGLVEAETFPAQLEAALRELGHDVRVINAGNSGDTTAAGLARLGWALQDDPDLAIVEFGANDGLRGIQPQETFANLDAILARLRAAGAEVLLAGMLAPRNLGADYTDAFDAVYPRLAERHGVPLYPFFLEGVVFRPWLNQHDGLHPNATGVSVIVEGIAPLVADMLDRLADGGGGDG